METVEWKKISFLFEKTQTYVYVSNRIWTTTYADALVPTVRKKKGKLHLLTSLVKAET